MKKKETKKNEDLEVLELDNTPGILDHINNNLSIYVGIIFLLFFVFSICSLFGFGGSLGGHYFSFITEKLGLISYPLPLFYLYISGTCIARQSKRLMSSKFLSVILFAASMFVFFGFLNLSGELGQKITYNLKESVGLVTSIFAVILVALGALAKIFETSILEIIQHKFSLKNSVKKLENNLTQEVETIEENLIETKTSETNLFKKLFPFSLFASPKSVEASEQENDPVNEADEYEEIEVEEEVPSPEEDVRTAMYKAAKIDMPEPEKEKKIIKKLIKKEIPKEREETKKENAEKLKMASDEYIRPPLSIYTPDSGKASAGDNKENARIIKRTLSDFGISVEMDEVTVGPTVTRYALKPAQGVKIEKIINLGNNIALELGVASVSITRIPERSLIGIEVPNKQKSKLGIANLLEKKEFLDRKERLTMSLGKDIYGDPVYVDLARMPHLLVAGTTGSGKSALIHALINSLIYKNSPHDLKFILIDPKKVEFAMYGNLPHLYTPIIKDPKKAIQTLNWLVQEMERRYQILEDCGKQNIGNYHNFVADKYAKALERGGDMREKLPEKMPYIVLIVDELADFMMKYPKEMESGIVKLAQMSRAVGIHLILATQRPSTNIITGVIKGNIPSRVALRVASQVDSRVIIDQGGAEKLLGYGDLLFVNSDGSDIKRIQSPFLHEEEIKNVVAFLRSKYEDIVTEELKARDGNVVGATNLSGGTVSDENFAEEDDKYEEAKQVVLQTKKTSVSNLQVRLGTGYARSAKLINMLESAGVIVTVNDPNGKPVKVVSGSQNETLAKSAELEKQADIMLEEADNEEGEEVETKKDSGSFFKF